MSILPPDRITATRLPFIRSFSVISAARAAEKPLSVSYWGPEGTFSHLAAIQTFGHSTILAPRDSIHDVFRAVEHGEAKIEHCAAACLVVSLAARSFAIGVRVAVFGFPVVQLAFDPVAAYTTSVVLALMALLVLILMRRLAPKEIGDRT